MSDSDKENQEIRDNGVRFLSSPNIFIGDMKIIKIGFSLKNGIQNFDYTWVKNPVDSSSLRILLISWSNLAALTSPIATP